jgi:plastocyanin
MTMRTLFTILLLIGLAACSASASSDAPSASGVPAETLSVDLADFMIQPSDVEVAGPTVTIAVTNDGPTPHNLTVRNEDGDVLMGTPDLSAGDSDTISGQLEPGTYTIFCSLAGHESLGMSATLTVTAP